MQIMKINGSAGCGKTHTIASMIAMDILAENNVMVVTPTNKAVTVLKSRLPQGIEVGTLHSLLYIYVPDTLAPSQITNTPKLDPTTGKIERDAKGNTVYNEDRTPKFMRVPRTFNKLKLYIDESSMVGSDIWADLFDGVEVEQYVEATGYDDPSLVEINDEGMRVIKRTTIVPFVGIDEIYALGDDKQLLPVEEEKDLSPHAKPWFRFWFKLEAFQTLTVNHRQKGDLVTFVDAIEATLFAPNKRGRFPSPLSIGSNDISSLQYWLKDPNGLEIVYDFILTADIIIVYSNSLRMVLNTVKRKRIARANNMPFIAHPIEGDQIIFKTRAKQAKLTDTDKLIYVAKNTCGKILKVIEYDTKTTGMSCIIELENGEVVGPMIVDYSEAVVDKYADKRKCYNVPMIDFGYCITSHSSQGGQWPVVLYVDHNDETDNHRRSRYVGVTRASSTALIITHVSKERSSGTGHIDILLKNA